MTTEILPNGIPVTRNGVPAPGVPTLLLVHGFLDDATVWDGFVEALGGAVATVRLDLPGSGARAVTPVAPDDLSLDLFAEDVAAVIDAIEGPFVLVGQSMGTQVVELAAIARPKRVVGIVLLTPVPLGGTRLPDQVVAPFRTLGGALEAQLAARSQLSPNLSREALDHLGRVGMLVTAPVVARYVAMWNNGIDKASSTSDYPGPVLIVRGDSDKFVTEELVTDAIAPRFPGADITTIPGGGHWLHVESPKVVADQILGFLGSTTTDDAASSWRSGFSEMSTSAFAEGFAEDVVLEASVLVRPIVGRALVAPTLATASGIYESLEFTAQTTDVSTTYLQWAAVAFGGLPFSGITILEKNTDGKVVRAAIHHRPLGAVLRFSAELRDRLNGIVPAEHFYGGEPDVV
ncbi:alpha/beta fold hydrolase [Streptomyces sp. NPDC101225]|uniref:alpha/beta fold hydrolase n=1 Tax=Streptomyces sp. NPDC101225 TaxID=3366135 RepID=UPI0038201799